MWVETSSRCMSWERKSTNCRILRADRRGKHSCSDFRCPEAPICVSLPGQCCKFKIGPLKVRFVWTKPWIRGCASQTNVEELQTLRNLGPAFHFVQKRTETRFDGRESGEMGPLRLSRPFRLMTGIESRFGEGCLICFSDTEPFRHHTPYFLHF